MRVILFILDACRDNPFESNWENSRSLKGTGLAKIPPPTGSLIAFSTSANTTANDGNGNNSLYCESLAKNLLLENTTIDQVFRNVRSDVIKYSNGKQTPVEASKLVGSAFYLVKTEKMNLAEKLESLEGKELSLFLNDYLKKRGLDKIDVQKYDKQEAKQSKLTLNDLYILGKDAMDNNKYSLAINYYSSALELKNEYNDAYVEYIYNDRGTCYSDIEKYQQASLDYDMAIKLNPEYSLPYINKGNLSFDSGKYEEALDLYNKALKLNPSQPIAYSNRGSVKGRLGYDVKDQISDYNKAIELDPEYAGAYYNRGSLKIDLKDYKGAIADFNKTIELDSEYWQAYINRGIAYDELKIYDKAIANYTKSIEINPNIQHAYFNRANSCRDSGLPFCADYKKACNLGSDEACEAYKEDNCK